MTRDSLLLEALPLLLDVIERDSPEDVATANQVIDTIEEEYARLSLRSPTQYGLWTRKGHHIDKNNIVHNETDAHSSTGRFLWERPPKQTGERWHNRLKASLKATLILAAITSLPDSAMASPPLLTQPPLLHHTLTSVILTLALGMAATTLACWVRRASTHHTMGNATQTHRDPRPDLPPNATPPLPSGSPPTIGDCGLRMLAPQPRHRKDRERF